MRAAVANGLGCLPLARAGAVNRMAAIGVTISHSVEQPEPRHATAEETSLLGIQKAALVTLIRWTYYSDEGRPVVTADIVVPAAPYEIVYEPRSAAEELTPAAPKPCPPVPRPCPIDREPRENSGARLGTGMAKAPAHMYWSGAVDLRWVWDLNPR